MSDHDNNITHISRPEDEVYLRKRLFDVNMRLYRASYGYRQVVIAAYSHIQWLCLANLGGYKLAHGMSGANAGIPWNIIGIARERGKPNAWCEIMINPKIVRRSPDMIESQSNCGSINLPEPITVRRHAWVDVEWYDVEGIRRTKRFVRESGGLTIQHEVDHNLGVLITDRAV